jgi:hypothetical protein
MFQLHNLVVVEEKASKPVSTNSTLPRHIVSLGASQSRIQAGGISNRSQEASRSQDAKSSPHSRGIVFHDPIVTSIPFQKPKIGKDTIDSEHSKSSKGSLNILLYVLCYNDESERLAHKRFDT